MHNLEKHAHITVVKLTIRVSKYPNFMNVLTTLPVHFSTFETRHVHVCIISALTALTLVAVICKRFH